MPTKKDTMQEDFSATVEAAIPVQKKLAQEGKLKEAIENLLVLEKQTRQGEDALSTSKVAVAILQICFEAKDYDQLNEQLEVLSKRRGQIRTVVQDFVREAMTYLDKLDHKEKMRLLETLRTITEGKIFVEIERARLTKILAEIKENEGNIAEAADILQEIQVETFGQLDKREKTEFILEQVRLCVEKADFIKANILANKISKKMLNDADLQDLKIKYYTLLIRIYSHESKYLDICKAYQAIYETQSIKSDEKEWPKYMQLMVAYNCLAKHDHEQSDLMNRINQDKNLSKLPAYKNLVTLFLKDELIRWPDFKQLFAPELNKLPMFSNADIWEDLRKRIVEHNIRVLATYYSRISMKRASQLLDLPAEEAEKFISELVVSKSVFARIDRPKGIINFRKRRDPNEFLNDWSHNVNKLLDLLEQTSHLIHREQMVHSTPK